MRYIKPFNEGISKHPQYIKGEVILWTKTEDAENKDFIQNIVKQYGATYKGQYYGGVSITTPVGKESEIGSQIVEDYPEFFSGWERFNAREDYLYEYLDSVADEVEMLRDSLGSLNKFGRTELPKDWNESIDEIIKKMENIKTTD